MTADLLPESHLNVRHLRLEHVLRQNLLRRHQCSWCLLTGSMTGVSGRWSNSKQARELCKKQSLVSHECGTWRDAIALWLRNAGSRKVGEVGAAVDSEIGGQMPNRIGAHGACSNRPMDDNRIVRGQNTGGERVDRHFPSMRWWQSMAVEAYRCDSRMTCWRPQPSRLRQQLATASCS